jgi:hypothetical protein
MKMPMLKKIFFVFFICLFSLLFASLALAIGISPADVYIDFVPNQEFVIDYSINSYRPFTFYTEGAFSEFTTIETLYHSDSQGNFRVHLKLPEEYPVPGKHRMYVAGKEEPPGGTVGAVAIIRGFIEIDVPFPGYYAELDVYADDVNEEEPVPISVAVHNRGKLNISSAKLHLDILSDDKVVRSAESDTVSILTNSDYNFQYTIQGKELRPGSYIVRATLTYEGGTKDASKGFRVGTFDVEVVNYTERMFNNSVNPFDVTVESRWNNPFSTVYLDLAIVNDSRVLSTAKTPPFDLEPWKQHTSSFYWNTAGIPIGDYILDMTVHFDGQSKDVKRKIFIVENLPPAVEAPAVSTSTVLLVLITILLVMFNIYFIFFKDRKRKEEENK